MAQVIEEPKVRSPQGGLLRRRGFRLFWIGETTSSVGSAMTVVALPLVGVLVLHASTFVVGLLGAVAWAPYLVIGLPAGAWVDRWPKRPLMLACDAVSFLAFASVPVAVWLGVLTVAQLVLVALVVGVAGVFFTTAYNPYLPQLVDEEDLPEANAKLQGAAAAARIAGPGLAGVVAQTVGAACGLLGDAVSFAVSAVCLSRVEQREVREEAPAEAGESLRTEIVEGVRFIVRDPYLRVLILHAGAGNFGEAVLEAVQVVFLVRTIGLAAGTAGVVVAVVGVGGVLGSIVSSRIARRFGSARGMLLCQVAGAPFALIVPLAATGFRMAFFVVGGMVYLAGVIAANVMLAGFEQSYIPENMRGRVGATAALVAYGAVPLGALVGAGIGEAFGPRTAVWVSALIMTFSVGLLFIGPLRRQRDFPAQPASVSA
jgi:predicted MFS family arabinose efflux permease